MCRKQCFINLIPTVQFYIHMWFYLGKSDTDVVPRECSSHVFPAQWVAMSISFNYDLLQKETCPIESKGSTRLRLEMCIFRRHTDSVTFQSYRSSKFIPMTSALPINRPLTRYKVFGMYSLLQIRLCSGKKAVGSPRNNHAILHK